ncbi:hypothetical protein Ciccas_008224 [Cichlidogyrus casuarinus]|uniref:Uncharacterized protein n=1 Tax=Cichlidogyrus casuarinus TaxID=1844966 RepID=A0ABD2Q0K7_9PLAT
MLATPRSALSFQRIFFLPQSLSVDDPSLLVIHDSDCTASAATYDMVSCPYSYTRILIYTPSDAGKLLGA